MWRIKETENVAYRKKLRAGTVKPEEEKALG